MSWHLCSCSAAALIYDPVTVHPTCCCGPQLWSLGDVRQPEFVGHADDSEHLAARLLSAHQNKHRRALHQPSHSTPCPALTEAQRLNTKDTRDPDSSNQNNVRVKGQAARSQSTFIPATQFHRAWLCSSGGSLLCFSLLDSSLRSFSSPPVCLSLLSAALASVLRSESCYLTQVLYMTVHICRSFRKHIKT